MQDPWEELQGDVERQLTEVEALIERWRITPGGRAAGASEKATLKAALLRSLREIETDLTDMAGVVETCRTDPATRRCARISKKLTGIFIEISPY